MTYTKLETEGGREVELLDDKIRTYVSGEHWRDFIDLASAEESVTITIGDRIPRLELVFDREEGTAVLRRGDTVLWEGKESPA